MKKLIAGNWKMNGSLDDARALIADVVNGIDAREELLERCDFLVCPPFVHIASARHAVHSYPHVMIGAQDCSTAQEGAYTGDVSAAMLADAGCSHVILGHSERRSMHAESDQVVREKALRAHEAGLVAVICVGESEEQRESNQQEQIVAQQLEGSLPETASAGNTVIAYEPVWAIGTGKTASPEDAGEMHTFIRNKLQSLVSDADNMRVLYGGSMKPENAQALLSTPNVDGGLIGGASLTAKQFLGIAQSA